MGLLARIRLAAAAAGIVSLAVSPPARAASPAECNQLGSLSLPLVQITSSTWNPATSILPEHCRVLGIIGPGKVGFAVQLPTDWNGNFYHQGGGGYVGSIPDASAGLARHYATAATDTGHQTSPSGSLVSWALNDPQAVMDFGYRAVHVTTTTAKAIIAAYYGRPVSRSYFVGCSRGGGQGLMEAQRFPDDFDGIVAGAPAFSWTALQMNFNWDVRAASSRQGTPIPDNKLPLIASAVVAACDAQDGLVDGLIEDPRRCSFDPASLQCSEGDAPDCLTAGQVQALERIYLGPRDSKGTQLAQPFLPGGEDDGSIGLPSASGNGLGPWITAGDGLGSMGFLFQDGFFRYIVFQDPAYDPFTFNEDTGPGSTAMIGAGRILDAVDPDLSPFKSHGGKMVMFHGWNDHSLSPLQTVQYYQQVIATMKGQEQTTDFFRFFLVPGMDHCEGGRGMDKFDALSALVNWVERGAAPDQILAASEFYQGRTRPLCPYPQEAVYRGTGSAEDADNFSCGLKQPLTSSGPSSPPTPSAPSAPSGPPIQQGPQGQAMPSAPGGQPPGAAAMVPHGCSTGGAANVGGLGLAGVLLFFHRQTSPRVVRDQAFPARDRARETLDVVDQPEISVGGEPEVSGSATTPVSFSVLDGATAAGAPMNRPRGARGRSNQA
jgi:feruloyl esterase